MRSSGRSWLVPLAMILVLSVCIAIAGNETASKDLINATGAGNITNATTNITAGQNITVPENLTASNLTANETTPQNVTNPFEKAMGRKPGGRR